jgi:hypothetical protein
MARSIIGTKLDDDVYVGDLVLYDDSFYITAQINMVILKGQRKIVLFENGSLSLHRSSSIKYPPPERITIMEEIHKRVRAGMDHFRGQRINSSEYAKFIQHNIDIEFP